MSLKEHIETRRWKMQIRKLEAFSGVFVNQRLGWWSDDGKTQENCISTIFHESFYILHCTSYYARTRQVRSLNRKSFG